MYKVSDIFEYKHFDSLTAFVDYGNLNLEKDRKSKKRLVSQITAKVRPDWFGTDNWEHACHLAQHGWPEGVRSLQDALTIISDGIGQVEMKQPLYDVCGPIAITGAYCSGDPECMLNPAEVEEKPIINVMVEVFASWTIDQQVIINRGAAILALVDQLEASGRRCSIFAAYCGRFNNAKDGCIHIGIVKLKDAGADFNLHTLSYALTNPSFLRRHCFRMNELSPKIKDPNRDGYASPCDLKSIEGVENAIGDIDLHFPIVNNCQIECATTQGATDYVLERARQANIIS